MNGEKIRPGHRRERRHRQGVGAGARRAPAGRWRSRADARIRSSPSPARSATSAAGRWCTACDVGDPEAVADAVRAIETGFGRLDLLFNNAGQSAPAVPLDELTWAQWKAVVDANLNGAFLCAQAAFGLMKRQTPQGGRIINNGSISAHVPRPMSAPYTATKHAITGLTKSIALDGRAHDIACGQIDIGNALTDMARKMTQGVPQADGRIAVEPTMDVEEVAAAIVHMASLPLIDQRAHDDHHGDQDAVRGQGVTQAAVLQPRHRLRLDQPVELRLRHVSELQRRVPQRQVVMLRVVGDLGRLVVADRRREGRHQHQRAADVVGEFLAVRLGSFNQEF